MVHPSDQISAAGLIGLRSASAKTASGGRYNTSVFRLYRGETAGNHALPKSVSMILLASVVVMCSLRLPNRTGGTTYGGTLTGNWTSPSSRWTGSLKGLEYVLHRFLVEREWKEDGSVNRMLPGWMSFPRPSS